MTLPAWTIPIAANSKRPVIAWRPFQRRVPNATERAQWASQFPNANAAIVTGTLTGLVVVDVDPGGMASLRDKALPFTYCVSTPRGGTHHYYQHPGGKVTSTVGLLKGVDVRADGGVIVCPPSSIHGTPYTVTVNAPLAPLPSWVTEMQRTRTATLEQHGVVIGTRHTTLTRLVGSWITHGHTVEEIQSRAFRFAHRCTPPLDDGEAMTVIASILQTRQRTRSPEHEWLLRGRDLQLSPADRLVLVALEAHRQELGRPTTFAAPQRLLATLTGLTQRGVGLAFHHLQASGLLTLTLGLRDPSGRRVSTITLCPTPSPLLSLSQSTPLA